MTTRVVLGTLALAATLAFAAPAAAKPVYEFGATECSVIELSGVGGIGLNTDLPTVRAPNIRRRVRDKARVYMRTDLYQWNGSAWTRIVTGDLWTAVAADDNYAIVWTNKRDGQVMHFPYERLSFVISTAGYYRVRQRILWYRYGKQIGSTRWTWLNHVPGGAFCTIT